MGFYGGVIVDVNAWDFAFNAVVGVDQPESGPVVGVALDVAASQNWAYMFSNRAQPADSPAPPPG